ncbi:hypothetical protein Tco_0717672 [Tanacetum coccineum]
MLPRSDREGDDKALYLQRIMTIDDDESAKESVPNKECMSGIHEKVVPKKATVRERDLVPMCAGVPSNSENGSSENETGAPHMSFRRSRSVHAPMLKLSVVSEIPD